MSAVFTCTACAITFEDLDSLKKHYKSDWHRYNLRRKVAGLEPVDQQDFDRRLAVALGSSAPRVDVQQRCEVCRKNLRSEGLYNQHLQSKKHKEAVKSAARLEAKSATSAATRNPPTDSNEISPVAVSPPPPAAGPLSLDATGGGIAAASPPQNATTVTQQATSSSLVKRVGDDMEDDSEGVEEDGKEMPPPRMGLTVCVFCNFESPSFEDNCTHMLREHGFFIPDVEYLVDPEGLVRYVEEKVKLGHVCLYCNGKGKTFHSYRSVQQHMTDRGHCKLLYEEGEDLHEYENFYDFSASYTEAEQNGIVRRATSDATAAAAGACTYERNGTDKLDGEMISDETDDDDDTDGDDHVEVSKTLSVTDLGELVLLDGKTVGNRQWRRYYRQRLRAPDEREVVVAQHRAMRLRLGAMYDEEVKKGTSTGGAVALQRGQRKAYGGLSGVARPKDVKMLRAHQRREARESLKTGLRQNKLNKTFDRVADM